jgi:hypothetical protein
MVHLMATLGEGMVSDGSRSSNEAALWERLRAEDPDWITTLREHHQPLVDEITNRVLADASSPPGDMEIVTTQTIAFGIAAVVWSKKREGDCEDVADFEAFLTPRLEARLRSSVLGDRSSDTWLVRDDFAAIGIEADGTA